LSLRDGPLGDIKVPLTWTAALAVVVAIVAALALLLGDRRETMRSEAYDATRKKVDQVAAPVGGVLSTPIHWLGSGSDYVKSYFMAGSENRRNAGSARPRSPGPTNASSSVIRRVASSTLESRRNSTRLKPRKTSGRSAVERREITTTFSRPVSRRMRQILSCGRDAAPVFILKGPWSRKRNTA